MMIRKALFMGLAVVAIAVVWSGSAVRLGAQPAAAGSGPHRRR